MDWIREARTKGKRIYTSTCGRYRIDYGRLLSAKAKYVLSLNDTNGTYLATFYNLGFAKRNAERHASTGRLIGHNAPQAN